MDDTRALNWVQRNRMRGWRSRVAVPVGDLAAGFAREAQEVDIELLRAADAVIRDVVDAGLAAHCRVGGLSGGTLVLYVDQPALVFPLRTRWSARLRGAMARIDTLRGVKQLRFEWKAAR